MKNTSGFIPMQKGQKLVRINTLTLCNMLAKIMEGDVTANEIVEEVGMHLLTVQRYLRGMHLKGIIHVSSWSEDARGRRTRRAFSFGSKRDVPRPVPKQTNAERAKDYRKREAQIRALGIAANDERRAA